MDDGVLLYAYAGCVFRVPEGVQPPKAGSLLFCRHLHARAGERMLEIGAGLGLAAVLAARAGASVVATDVVPAAVEVVRLNAALNGVSIDARLGDCYAPVTGERFDLVCSNPPHRARRCRSCYSTWRRSDRCARRRPRSRRATMRCTCW